jgi:hypothetical protein
VTGYLLLQRRELRREHFWVWGERCTRKQRASTIKQSIAESVDLLVQLTIGAQGLGQRRVIGLQSGWDETDASELIDEGSSFPRDGVAKGGSFITLMQAAGDQAGVEIGILVGQGALCQVTLYLAAQRLYSLVGDLQSSADF